MKLVSGRKVDILRAIPGTGKSTLAKERFPKALTLSADDELYIDGKFVFTKERQANAHMICLGKFVRAVENPNIEHIIIDNTNCNPVDFAPYAALAQLHGCEVQIFTLRIDDPMIALSRNIHGIPATEEEANDWQKKLDIGSTQIPSRWSHTIFNLEIIGDKTPEISKNVRELRS